MKTDAQIKQDVLAELKWEAAIRADAVGVEVRDGVVALDGHVESFAEKAKTESAVERIQGVKQVVSGIEVRLPGMGIRVDSDIAQLANKVLEWTSTVPVDAVRAKVQKGWLTLSGEVAWQFQRQDAEDAIRHLSGITGVTNNIRIKPKAPAESLRTSVELALKRGYWPDREQITVAASDGEITLTGAVQSRAERELAAHSAWSAPGVNNVINKITVNYE